MAEVTAPLTLNSTSQEIVTKLNALNSKMDTVNTNLASIASGGSGGGNVPIKVTMSSTDIIDSVTPLPTGEIYLVYATM